MLAVLVADPCSLLDPITPALHDRWVELSRDVDGQGGRITPSSQCEARLALTLEARGILDPIITRPLKGDAEDGRHQVWDFKGPHSQAAIADRIAIASGRAAAPPADGFPGEFDVEIEVARAVGQQQVGKGVVFDLRRLTVDQARQLVGRLQTEPDVDPALIRYFPSPEQLSAFDRGGHG